MSSLIGQGLLKRLDETKADMEKEKPKPEPKKSLTDRMSFGIKGLFDTTKEDMEKDDAKQQKDAKRAE